VVFVEVTHWSGGLKRELHLELGERPLLRGEQGAEFRLYRAVKGGGNGVVFQAQRRAAGGEIDVCAVKALRQLDATRVDRFANERRILSRLNHRRIAAYYDAGAIEVEAGVRTLWMAMDLGGDNLRQHVQERGPLRPGLLRRVALQLCEAVQYVHEADLIHRDLKPDNLVWVGDCAAGEIKLIDFGIAKFNGEDVSGRPLDDFTRTDEFIGPLFYSSPELIAYATNKAHPVDHRSDLFQLGKVLWFLGTGRVSAGIPFRGQDPTGGLLHALVMELVTDEPNERLDSANVIAGRIQRWEVD